MADSRPAPSCPSPATINHCFSPASQLAIFAVALAVLRHFLASVHLDDVLADLRAVQPSRLLASALFAACSYGMLTLYDYLRCAACITGCLATACDDLVYRLCDQPLSSACLRSPAARSATPQLRACRAVDAGDRRRHCNGVDHFRARRGQPPGRCRCCWTHQWLRRCCTSISCRSARSVPCCWR